MINNVKAGVYLLQNNTFVTLVSSQSYFIAALILNLSFKQSNNKIPFTICLTENLVNKNNLNILKQENIPFEIIKCLNYNENIQKLNKNHSVLNTASKIEIFNLKQYNKIIYIDADSLILYNIEDLINYPDGSILKYPYEKYGMSGLFVIKPKNHDYDIYKFLIENYNGYDGEIIGKLFFPFLSNKKYQIPNNYLYNINNYLTFSKNIKGIHFNTPIKPFLFNNTEIEISKQNIYFKLYFTYFDYLKNKYDKL